MMMPDTRDHFEQPEVAQEGNLRAVKELPDQPESFRAQVGESLTNLMASSEIGQQIMQKWNTVKEKTSAFLDASTPKVANDPYGVMNGDGVLLSLPKELQFDTFAFEKLPPEYAAVTVKIGEQEMALGDYLRQEHEKTMSAVTGSVGGVAGAAEKIGIKIGMSNRVEVTKIISKYLEKATWKVNLPDMQALQKGLVEFVETGESNLIARLKGNPAVRDIVEDATHSIDIEIWRNLTTAYSTHIHKINSLSAAGEPNLNRFMMEGGNMLGSFEKILSKIRDGGRDNLALRWENAFTKDFVEVAKTHGYNFEKNPQTLEELKVLFR